MTRMSAICSQIAQFMLSLAPLRNIIYRSYFFLCKTAIAPNSLMVMFESAGGGDCAGDPKALYETMLEDARYEAFDFRWSVQPENAKKLKWLKGPRTQIVSQGKKAYFRQMANAKYWITDGPLPKYITPGKEHVWILTSQGLLREEDIVIDQKKWSKEKKRCQNLAKRVGLILSDGPECTRQLKELLGLKALGIEHKIVEAPAPRSQIYHTYHREDVFRARMDVGIPLRSKVILVDLPDEEKLAKMLADLTGKDILWVCRDAALSKRIKEYTNEAAALDYSDYDKMDPVLNIACDVLLTNRLGTLSEYVSLNRPVIFLGQLGASGVPCFTQAANFHVADSLDALVDFVPLALEAAGAFWEPSEEERQHARQEMKSTAAKLVDYAGSLTERQRRERRRTEQRRTAFNWLTGQFRRIGLNITPNTRKMAGYKNIHKGRRCFLVGNGPSLTCRDLELIRGEITFGCNLIFKSFDLTNWRPDYFFIVDNMYWKTEKDYIVNNLKMPLITVASNKDAIRPRPKNLAWGYTIRNEYRPYGNPNYLVNVKHSSVMILMIEMAIYMGFSEIYLLGVDAGNTASTSGPAHFMDGYKTSEAGKLLAKRGQTLLEGKKMTVEELGKYTVQQSHKAYAALREYADKRGDVHIYNATRGGYLEAFKRVCLDDVVGREEAT